MMDVTSIGSDTGTVSGANQFSDLTSEEFMDLLFTELSNQDPFEPQDSEAIMNQINMIREIEANVDLMNNLEALIDQNSFATAGNLVGKHIEGLDDTYNHAEGRVVSAAVEGDSIILMLETGARVPFDNVSRILESPDLAGE
jgi:flagellar hook assembly protein FlgD